MINKERYKNEIDNDSSQRHDKQPGGENPLSVSIKKLASRPELRVKHQEYRSKTHGSLGNSNSLQMVDKSNEDVEKTIVMMEDKDPRYVLYVGSGMTT